MSIEEKRDELVKLFKVPTLNTIVQFRGLFDPNTIYNQGDYTTDHLSKPTNFYLYLNWKPAKFTNPGYKPAKDELNWQCINYYHCPERFESLYS